MTSIHRPLDTSTTIRPVQLLSVGDLSQVPAPLIRVWTCGLLTLEIVQEMVSTDPPQARYTVLTPDLLHGRGVAPSLTLLKLLVSRPHRFAPADWLREQFCHAHKEAFSSKRLDTLAWMLRDLLCPPAYESLRSTLLLHTRAMSGSGYHLAASPLLWVDHEALSWNVEQAVRMERFGDDPLPFWQRAYELATRGEYLPDEVYSEWAEVKREEIAGLRRQSVQALARLYTEREGRAGEEQALVLLRSSWLEHPREENLLRPLMELLGKRDWYQEALAYYKKLCNLLEEDGQQPDSHTQDVAEYVRTKQIQRTSHSPSVSFSHRENRQLAFQEREQQQRWENQENRDHSASYNKETASEDHGKQSIKDDTESDEDMNRRQATKSIGLFIGGALLTGPRDLFTPPALDKFSATLEEAFDLENVTSFQKLTEASWHLLKASELDVLERIQSSYLPRLEELAHHKSTYQKEVAGLLSQSYQAAGILASHRLNLDLRKRYHHLALQYSLQAGDGNIHTSALIQLASAFQYLKQPQRVLQVYQAALPLLHEASPLLGSCVYLGLADASAQCGQKQEALRYLGQARETFPEHPQDDPLFLYSDAGFFSLVLYEGLTFLGLERPEDAWNALAQIEKYPQATTPERLHIEIINLQAEAALAARDLDRFCDRVEAGRKRAVKLGSEKRYQEAYEAYRHAKLIWQNEPRIQSLAGLFVG